MHGLSFGNEVLCCFWVGSMPDPVPGWWSDASGARMGTLEDHPRFPEKGGWLPAGLGVVRVRFGRG